jgi:aspartate/methionine/tyrosine aminotransferase
MITQPSPIRQIMKMASTENILNMGLNPDELISYGGGWVDHLAPKTFQDCYIDICSNNDLFHEIGKYSPTLGMPECRTQLTCFEKQLFNCRLGIENVIIGNSSTQLTHDLFVTLANPQDTILLFDPCYANYPGQINMTVPKAKIIYLPVLDTQDWKYMHSPARIIEQFKKLYEKYHPKITLFSTPDNPSGQIIPPDVVKAIMDITHDGNTYTMIDYAYKTQCFQKPPAYFSWSPNEYPNLISIHSNSKWCHGLGRRLGWIEAHASIIDALERTQQCSILCPDTLHQVALAQYLKKSLKDNSLAQYLDSAQKDYQKASKITIEGIKTYLDMPYLTPQGGLYTLMKVDEDGNKFVKRVLKATNVLFIPGKGFGKTLKEGVRISYGPLVRKTEKISEGLHRVGTYLNKKQ